MRSPGSSDFQVKAHWVVLCAVLRAGGVEGDDLVAEDEIAGDSAGDGCCPGVVVGYMETRVSFLMRSGNGRTR